MPRQALSRCRISRAFIAWVWLFLALALPLGSTLAPASTQLSQHGDTLAAPAPSLEWVATTVQKSRAAEPVFESWPTTVLLPAIALVFPLRAASTPAWRESTPSFASLAQQTPHLPRPPPQLIL